ncbi:MAG: hypothetical protein M1819_003314 [Sarea resinae]|nr:MAG: hypothetical protein M1819_003314 [Sarea resinae]
MDPQFHANIPNLAASNPQQLAPLSVFSPHTIPSNSQSAPPLGLPTLQPQNAAISFAQSMYGHPSSAPHTPRTPHTPSTPVSGGQGGLPQLAPQPSLHDLQLPSYMSSGSPFSTSQPMSSQVSMASSHPSIAPAPNQGRLPVPLRPMPSGGLSQQLPLPSQYQAQGMSQPQLAPNPEPQPTHVVGSQGRRGILPSAPGRAAAVTAGTVSGGKSTTIPAKDADGKFPCPHCNKTYLHAKHLKRHLLRHTGDRPYMCILCKDTFSRSDILKRHFQKCSLRRGNPTGASHLSHSQAHLKKTQPGQQKASTTGVDHADFVNSMNGSAMGYTDGTLNGNLAGLNLPNGASSYLDGHQPTPPMLSRAGSIKRSSSGEHIMGRNRSMTAPSSSGSNGMFGAGQDHITTGFPANLEHSLSAFSVPHSQAAFPPNFAYKPGTPDASLSLDGSSKDPSPLSYSRPPLPHYSSSGSGSGQSHDLDWSHMFQPGGQDGFMSAVFNSSSGQVQAPIKAEVQLPSNSFDPAGEDHQDSMFNGIYSTPTSIGADGTLGGFPHWNMDFSHNDPLQAKANRLAAFCFQDGAEAPDRSQANDDVRQCFTVDNVRHFVELFTNVQGHFPIIHMPTFNIFDAYDGLVLMIVCVGAVYSDRVSVSQVRHLMEHAKASLQRNSRLFAPAQGEHPASMVGGVSEIQELQAFVILQALFTWHGTEQQRAHIRQDFPALTAMARSTGLLQVAPLGHPAFSVLHQLETVLDHPSDAGWDWLAWVEQERRSRVIFLLFVLDAAFAIYFNIPPQFEPLEIQVPLPADDACWDATSAMECADALGLHGPVAQQRNFTGTRLTRQPEMHQTMKVLLHFGTDLRPMTTNAVSKFILIHALHVQIFNVQRQLSQTAATMSPGDQGSVSSGGNTPIGQNDWLVPSSALSSNSSSRNATPDSFGAPSPGAHQLLKATTNAIQKWKNAWDEDMTIQYPLSRSRFRRFGFCRDGVHFYWLARAFLRSNRATDWQMAPEQRFAQVLGLLKNVRAWVASDNAMRGEDIGSVGDIDESYGVENLTLDMSLLFKPINQHEDSPVPGVQTNLPAAIL